jgi:molybdopterin converting factor small subunit
MEIRIRLGAGIARLASTPLLMVEVPDGTTVDGLYERLGEDHPDLAPALRSALPVIGGRHAERSHALAHGDEVALLIPVAGGEPTSAIQMREELPWRLSR